MLFLFSPGIMPIDIVYEIKIINIFYIFFPDTFSETDEISKLTKAIEFVRNFSKENLQL